MRLRSSPPEVAGSATFHLDLGGQQDTGSNTISEEVSQASRIVLADMDQDLATQGMDDLHPNFGLEESSDEEEQDIFGHGFSMG